MPRASRTINKKLKTVNQKQKFQVSSFKFQVKSGFTLIELLIVITIIGILAGMALASYGGTQEMARDSRRKQELDSIKKALELAKQDTPGAYYYADCQGNANCGASLASVPLTTRVTLTPTYIPVVPKDPKTNNDYTYTPSPATCNGTCTNYSLKACLENSKDLDGIADLGCAPGKAYTVRPN